MDASRFHESLVIVDTHQDTIQRVTNLGHDLAQDRDDGYFDIPKMRRGNLKLVFQACCVDHKYIVAGQARQRQDELLDALQRFCDDHPKDFFIVERAEQLAELATSPRAGILVSVEGTQAIGADLRYLEKLYGRGCRSIGLTHFTTNDWADSSTDVERHGGLSALGREGIAELNRLKVMVDLSHCSDKAFWQTLEISKAAPFASHSCSRSFVDISRNMSDEMMVALAKAGGVIGLNFVPEYIHPPFIAALADYGDRHWPVKEGEAALPPGVRLMRSRAAVPADRYRAMVDAGLPAPDLDVVIRHIDHAVALLGPEHVCIGSDHGAVLFDVEGLEDCGKLPKLTEALLARGYAENDVRLIMGGSVLDYMRRVMG